MATIRFGDRTIALPTSRLVRTIIGILLVVGGVLGFLPVLGFWMIPLGILVLSVDFAPVRRLRRRAQVKGEKFRRRRNGEAVRGDERQVR